VELQEQFGYQAFTVAHYRRFAAELAPLADQTHQGIRLAQALVEALRQAKIILPAVPVMERLCAEVVVRAQRRLYRGPTAPLSEEQKSKIEALLSLREGIRQTVLAWLRQPAGAPSARNLVDHLARLQALREVGLPPEATLARPADFDYLGLLSNHYPQLRRYAPAFLEAFEFRAAPAAQKLLEAVEVLKRLAVSNARSIPEDAPTAFVRRRWAPHVFTASYGFQVKEIV
jgi:hypothetical protein